jgi:hypothetical protein
MLTAYADHRFDGLTARSAHDPAHGVFDAWRYGRET